MQKPFTGSSAARLWNNMKKYITEHTYPREPPPDLFFDTETSTLYMGKQSVGYEFVVVDSILYYRER